MKKFIIAVLCFIVWVVVMCLLWTYNKTIYNMLFDFLGAWYSGVLIGKFAGWLCDK